jgi:altronate dehydratase
MPRIALTVHPDDNVATLLDARVDERSTQQGLVLKAGIPFGHKVALRSIAEGEAVVKYGVPIGTATAPIAAGDHVHVHNCR